MKACESLTYVLVGVLCFLIAMSFSGCSQKNEVLIPQKCVTPDVPRPPLALVKGNDLEMLKGIAVHLGAKRDEAKQLRKASEICK